MFESFPSFKAMLMDGPFWWVARKLGRLVWVKKPVPTILIEVATGPGTSKWGQNRRTFHLNERVSDVKYFNHYGSSGHLTDTRGRKAPNAVNDLYQALKSVKGVDEVSIYEYEIHVVIGHAFLWKHIEPTILDLLKTNVGWTGRVKTSTEEHYYQPARDSMFV